MDSQINAEKKFCWGAFINFYSILATISLFEKWKGFERFSTLCSATRFYKQRVKLAKCDSDEVLQKFDFVNGKIHPRTEHRLCAGYEFDRFEEFGQTNFIFSTCFPGVFGFGAENVV